MPTYRTAGFGKKSKAELILAALPAKTPFKITSDGEVEIESVEDLSAAKKSEIEAIIGKPVSEVAA